MHLLVDSRDSMSQCRPESHGASLRCKTRSYTRRWFYSSYPYFPGNFFFVAKLDHFIWKLLYTFRKWLVRVWCCCQWEQLMMVPTLKMRKSIFETTLKEPKFWLLTCTTWPNASDLSILWSRPLKIKIFLYAVCVCEVPDVFLFFSREYILKKKKRVYRINSREKLLKRNGNCVLDLSAVAPNRWLQHQVYVEVRYS